MKCERGCCPRFAWTFSQQCERRTTDRLVVMSSTSLIFEARDLPCYFPVPYEVQKPGYVARLNLTLGIQTRRGAELVNRLIRRRTAYGNTRGS